MTKHLLVLLIMYTGLATAGNDTIKLESRISDVTVFFNGAQVTRQATLKFLKGKQLVLITGLPAELNPQSLQIASMDGATILSVKHQVTSWSERGKGKGIKDLEDKIDSMKDKAKSIMTRFRIYETEEKILLDNSVISKKDEGAVVLRIKEAADFYRTRLNEIAQQKAALMKEHEQCNKAIQDQYLILNELQSKRSQTFSQIYIALDCHKDGSAPVRFTYYVPSAGWEPIYDFRVEEVTKPLVIVYNAAVYQATTEDWNQVKIKLSSSDPVLSGTKPELPIWRLGVNNPGASVPVRREVSSLKGVTLDSESDEPLPFVNVQIYKGNELVSSMISDVEGNYSIKPISSGSYSIKCTYVGYNTTAMNIYITPGKVNHQDIRLKASTVALQEVEVVSGSTVTREEFSAMPSKNINSVASTSAGVLNLKGSRSSGTDYYIDGDKAMDLTEINYIANSLTTNIANLEYAIETPYTIPSDGKDYTIRIKEVSTPVNYVYYAIPKLDKDVFLTAELVNWNQFNFLSGRSNIYYQGTYTGQTEINVNQVRDTMIISLGRDKNILVKREYNKSISDRRFISDNVVETLGWDITVRNNKGIPVRVIIEDQYPLSQRKSVEVERLDNGGARLDDKTGKLKWEVTIAPDEKKTVTFKYSVKYPKTLSLKLE